MSNFVNIALNKPLTIMMSSFATISATGYMASTEFAKEYPELMNYFIGIISLAFVYAMIYIWKTSWKQQNEINEKIIDRLEKLDSKMDEKIERLKEEVYKSEINHASMRNGEKEGLKRDNKQLQIMIRTIKDLTEKIKKVEIVKN